MLVALDAWTEFEAAQRTDQKPRRKRAEGGPPRTRHAAGAGNNRFQAVTAVPRSLIKYLEVPLVPVADQDTISVGGFILDTVRHKGVPAR